MKLLFPIFLVASLVSIGQPVEDSVVVVDLSKDWMVMEDQTWVPYQSNDHSNTRIIYLEIDPGRYPGGSKLQIQSSKPLSVYLNYKLLRYQSNNFQFSLDSLQREMSPPWMFSVYQADGLSWLQTKVVHANGIATSAEIVVRESNYFLDFSILATLVLFISFIVFLQTNPRLTLDYFNFVRLFSIQEREDSLLNSRISASVNILYYLFGSIFIAFALLTIFHFGADKITIGESFKITSLGSAFFQWGKLSLFVSGALVIRLIILSAFTSLYDFKEALSVQFYNSVRLGFFISTLSCTVCLVIFILGIQSPVPYRALLASIIFFLIFWVFMVGLKLMRRSGFRFFHLFSYLCASELVPVVILVKVLNS